MKDADKLSIRDVAGGAVMAVKVVPGASRDKIVGVLGQCLKIATSTAPEKGKANTAVGKILAKALDIQAQEVALVSGPTNPRKEFQIAGLSAAAVRKKLQAL